MNRSLVRLALVAAAAIGSGLAGGTAPAAASTATAPVIAGNFGSEVEQASQGPYVYDAYMASGTIQVAVSSDSGRTWSQPGGLLDLQWDPAVAVAPNGTVYVVGMGGYGIPIVYASFDHGQRFTQETTLPVPAGDPGGDRPFIAVGPTGDVYVTWDDGARPNIAGEGGGRPAIERSTDGGKTWGPLTLMTSGSSFTTISAPLVVEPSGKIDALIWGQGGNPPGSQPDTAHEYFTSSKDNGQTWTAPIEVGGSAGDIGGWTGWIDGSLGLDAGGNLYATWDTNGNGTDTGWLAYSTNGGRSWSVPRNATSSITNDAHATDITEVVGGPDGSAYVGVEDYTSGGWQTMFETFHLGKGFGPVQQVSQPTPSQVWLGDTFGISVLGSGEVGLTWAQGNVYDYSGYPSSNEMFSAVTP